VVSLWAILLGYEVNLDKYFFGRFLCVPLAIVNGVSLCTLDGVLLKKMDNRML
jgi:hypothetical protein